MMVWSIDSNHCVPAKAESAEVWSVLKINTTLMDYVTSVITVYLYISTS